MTVERFTVAYEGAKLMGDTLPPYSPSSLLMMHGAGKGERGRFYPYREKLAQEGIVSTSFDYVGHGETGGDLIGSSLSQRTAQAEAVIRDRGLQQPLVLIGASMSGYTAIKLTQVYAVKSLVLIVPAVYHTGVYDTPFGGVFSGQIREDRSWEKTDAWELLGQFRGKLTVVAAERDQIVPKEITERIYEAATRASERSYVTVKNAPHKVLLYANENPEAFNQVYKAIRNVI